MGFWDMYKKSTLAYDKMMLAALMKHMKSIMKETNVNLSLLQQPKKIKAGTRTTFVYAPCELTVNGVIDPGECINIIDVFEGDTPEETTLKVMRHTDWIEHTKSYYQPDNEPRCITRQDGYDRNDKPCICHMEPDDMPESFRSKVHYVLLTDVGK